MNDVVHELANARIGNTFNQYAAGPRAHLLRARLAAYLAAAQIRKLKVYAGPEHPHEAQSPKTLEV